MADRNRNDYEERQRRWRDQRMDWDYDPDQDMDWQNNRDQSWQGDYDRTRQWRGQVGRGQSSGDRFNNQEMNPSYRRGPSYNQGRNSDFGRENTDRYMNYGRSEPQYYSRSGSQSYDSDWYNWNSGQDFNEMNEYDRDDINEIFNQGRYSRGQGQSRGPSQRGTGGMGSDYRGESRGRYQRETGGMGSDYRGETRGQYRSAGMGSDYGGSGGYENRGQYDSSPNYRRGDVGYDSEGAFYQDLDEAQNYERWDMPGRFTGMGPANYQRKDERIQDEISERLTRHGRVDASDIEVTVNNGEVTLRGSVPSREMKRMAEDMVEDISGVKDIHNEIRVRMQDAYRQDADRPEAYQNRSRGFDPTYNHDTGQSWESKWPGGAENSMTGQTNAGAGLTDSGRINPGAGQSGATSISGMEAASGVEAKKRQIREGMEVIGKNGKVVGRVKTIRQDDFLIDRELARDVYVPFEEVKSVGAQILLDVAADEVDQQGWEKPSIL